jgi:hypothetical protein
LGSTNHWCRGPRPQNRSWTPPRRWTERSGGVPVNAQLLRRTPSEFCLNSELELCISCCLPDGRIYRHRSWWGKTSYIGPSICTYLS